MSRNKSDFCYVDIDIRHGRFLCLHFLTTEHRGAHSLKEFTAGITPWTDDERDMFFMINPTYIPFLEEIDGALRFWLRFDRYLLTDPYYTIRLINGHFEIR